MRNAVLEGDYVLAIVTYVRRLAHALAVHAHAVISARYRALLVHLLFV